MSSQETYFLSFLEQLSPDAAHIAKKMEELIFADPSSSVVKARLFIEIIINEVIKLEEIEVPFQSKLFDKILLLNKEGILNREIQQAFDTVRFSGNKAAHEARYNDITEAFKLHKEMYRIGAWFFELYSNELSSVPAYEVPKPQQKDDVKDVVEKTILDLIGAGLFDTVLKDIKKGDQLEPPEDSIPQIEKSEENMTTQIFKTDLGSGESYLLRELRRLKDSSQEAIENANQFSQFKKYLHVDRKIQLDLEEILQSNKNRERGNLILLCGSVGDGKSHLLAFLKERKSELIGNYKIFNDATESFSPNKNAMETLEDVLRSFSDENIENTTDKVILAINLGILHNFIHMDHREHSYNKLKQFIEQSELFSENITTTYSDDTLDLLSFGDYHTYELTENGPKSSFYSTLLKKITNPTDVNPFYLALKEDEKNDIHYMVHENYRLLQDQFVQDQIVQIIIQSIVTKKLVISARAFLNFIADIVIPDESQNIRLMNDFDILEYSLPNLLFNRKERSPILQVVSGLDPIHRRSVYIDQLVIKLNTLHDWKNIIDDYVKNDIAKQWLKPVFNKNEMVDQSFNLFFELFTRIIFLTNEGFLKKIQDNSYSKFLKNLYYFNTRNKKEIKSFYEEVKTAIFKWKGSPKRDYIFLNKPTEKYRIAQKLHLRPTIEHLKTCSGDVLESFRSSITLAYHDGNSDNKVFLDIDFSLYSLLLKVQEGYRPNKKDEEDAIKFVEFIEQIMLFGEKGKEILVHFPQDNRFYTIKRDDFGAFVFEKE